MALGRVLGSIAAFIWFALNALRKTLHLILLLFIFAILIAVFQSSIPVIPHTAALVLNPQGQIVEQLSGDPFDRAIGRATSAYAPETQLRDIVDALNAAATDKRIKVVVLDLEQMGGAGLSKLQEIGAALNKFRASGKKVLAVSNYYQQPQYYLAAHADEINLDPLGGVLIEGFGRYHLYFKEALEKVGVNLNVFKVGTYKSFTETFTRTDMSPEERQQSLTYLNAFWSAYQADVTRARKLPPDALAKYVDQSVAMMQATKGNAAQVALEQKLVTAIKTREQMNEELKRFVGEDKDTHLYNAVDLSGYVTALRAEQTIKYESSNEIGVLVASGEILDGPQPSGTIGGESLSRTIREARDDKKIKALVLRIDSPGGSMLASEQIYRELKAFAATGRPIVASMSSLAASGGYYIALGADEILASPVTLTGSIGVFATIPTFQETLKKIGVHSDGVGTTVLSGSMQLERDMTPEAKALLQTGIEYAYAQFLARVSDNREMPIEAVDAVAQGRVWAGTDAKVRGLVDGLGNLQAAVESAAKLAKLEKKYGIRYLEPQFTWQESLAMDFRGFLGRFMKLVGLERFFSPGLPAQLRQVTDPLEREVKRWARFNDPRGLYSYCFCSAT